MDRAAAPERARGVEWPTVGLIAADYLLWAAAVFGIALWSPVMAAAVAGVAAALHSSLTHEAIHGHPTRLPAVNAALLVLPLSLWVPYLRFQDTHLAHHHEQGGDQ